MLAAKPLYQVDVPPETPEDWEREVGIGRAKYGRFFKNEEEFLFFWMLPLDNEGREMLLKRAWEEKCELVALASCPGSSETPADHRIKCIKCCVTARPSCAVPFF